MPKCLEVRQLHKWIIQSLSILKDLGPSPVETLFKDSSGKVMKYAENAYKTAGLSSNEYMETVTSFSASLLQGLGGDTEAAAEMANVAIVDMSDNANKMGTSMELIQNAYQGFAKGNYTMLDNLKLGYGGTQEEMVRLINDSGVLKEKIESMDGVKFDTVIEAIHEVQTNIGITGTTAKEAESTIQGSASAMKSAWENLLVGIAAGDQDVSMLFEKLYDSGMVFADNLIPRIKTTIEGFFNLLSEKLPFIEELAVVIGIVTAAVAMHNAVQAIRLAMNAAEVTSLGALISMKLASAAATMAALAPYLLIAAAIAAVIAVGVLLYKNWDKVKEKCGELAGNLKEKFSEIKAATVEKFNAVKQTIGNVMNAAKNTVNEKLTNMKNAYNKHGGGIKGIAAAAMEGVKGYYSAGFTFIDKLTGGKLSNVASKFKSKMSDAKEAVSKRISSIKSSFSNGLSNALNTVTSKFNSIKSKISSVMDSARDKVKSAIDRIKGFFNFSWKLPKPGIPKFSVSGGEAPWGFGGKGSLPSIGIKWHANAMNNPDRKSTRLNSSHHA